MLSALQSQQEGLHTPMLHMVLAVGTMMLFEAKEVILGSRGTGECARCPDFFLCCSDHRGLCSHLCLDFTGWFEGTPEPLSSIGTWMPLMTLIS